MAGSPAAVRASRDRTLKSRANWKDNGMTKHAHRREVIYTLHAVHNCTKQRVPMGSYGRRVHAMEDGRFIDANYRQWHGEVNRVSLVIWQTPTMGEGSSLGQLEGTA